MFASIVPANIRSHVYCTALAEGGLEEWEFVWSRFNQSNVESEKQKLLKALACTNKFWLLNRFAICVFNNLACICTGTVLVYCGHRGITLRKLLSVPNCSTAPLISLHFTF